jgi:Tfp pilus assembly protein PilO
MTGADLTAILKKHPLSVICGLIAVICGALLYYRAGNIAASQTELDARTAEANKMIANVRNSTGLAEQVAEIQSQRKELEARLLKAGQLAVNLQYFYKLEAETEVKLQGDARQGVAAKTNRAYIGVPFAVSVQGTYSQVANFINRLQNGRHFCRITSSTLSKGQGGDSGATTAGAPDMLLSLNLELLGQP